EILKTETLGPAKQQAEEILKAAKEQAEQIILEAKKQAKKILEDTRQVIEQERNVFHSSLAQSSKQSLEALKQMIEQKLFNENIEDLITKESSAPQVIAKLIEAIISGIQKEGVSKDFTLIIPKNLTSEEMALSLAADVLEQLTKSPITVGGFNGGVQ